MVSISNVEKVIVVKPGVAVPSAGDRLYNPTTNAINMAVGSIGAYVETAGSSNPTALNPATYAGESFRFIQRRDPSLDPAPLPRRQWEMSQYINGSCPKGLEIAGEPYNGPSVNSWIVGAPNAGTTGKIGIASNNLYTLDVAANGWRVDLMHSYYNTPIVQGRFESFSWGATAYATENRRRDYTVKALVQDLNRKASYKGSAHAIAIAIDSAGTTTTGPTIASVIAAGAGNTIVIGYDSGCTPVRLLIDQDRLNALIALEAKLTAAVVAGGYGLGAGAAKIALYAFEGQSCAAGIELAGGTASTADMIFVLAQEQALAYYDEVAQTRKRLDVTLNEGSLPRSATKKLVSLPSEGSGQARNLRLMYENTEHYRSYTSSRKWGANHVAYPDFILDNEVYDIYTVTHCNVSNATSGLFAESPLLTMVAVVHTNRAIGTSPFSTGAVNPQKTYIEAVLNAVGTYHGVHGPINI